MAGKLETEAEVDQYLSGETVECLICGDHSKQLANHVRYKHHITPRAYKKQFGIPYKRALMPKAVRAVLREQMVVRMKEQPALREQCSNPGPMIAWNRKTHWGGVKRNRLQWEKDKLRGIPRPPRRTKGA